MCQYTWPFLSKKYKNVKNIKNADGVDDASGDNIMTKIWGRGNSVRLRVGVIAITQKAFVLRRAHKYWIFNENTKKQVNNMHFCHTGMFF